MVTHWKTTICHYLLSGGISSNFYEAKPLQRDLRTERYSMSGKIGCGHSGGRVRDTDCKCTLFHGSLVILL
jgi:hypothetical protein